MNRVVVTGLGVVSPIGHGTANFAEALRRGTSGIRFCPELRELGFSCQVAGLVDSVHDISTRYFDSVTMLGMDRHAIFGSVAGIDCWQDAGLPRNEDAGVDWETSICFGTGIGGIDTVGKTVVPKTDTGSVRRLGSTIIERIMGSAVSARLAGLLGIGGQASSNSSACATGTEAIVNGYWAVKEGRAKRVLAGGCEGDSPYAWAGFDSMRVLSRAFNDTPELASRPLSATAGGFVPAAGAGAVLLESMESAIARGAYIHAEVIGGAVNCGGQRNGGTMTAGNAEGVQRCIRAAIQSAGIASYEIDLISGHLTGTMADALEVSNWRAALAVSDSAFPLLNAPKSLFGHTLGAAGGIESVAAILQLRDGFVHPSINCEDLRSDLRWCRSSIPQVCVEKNLGVVAKASFGFGDVNACVLFRKFTKQQENLYAGRNYQ